MSLEIIGVIAVAIIAVIIISLNYKNNEALKCPHCQIDFTSDLFFLSQNTLAFCPFCHHWMTVTRVADRNAVKKLFEGLGGQREHL